MHKTFLIIGASGYIGSYFLKNILETTSNNIIATHTINSSPSITDERIKWFNLDVTDFSQADSFCQALNSLNTKFNVIYLSAYHHPDKVEENKKLAWNINITSLSNIINTIPNINTFYYSSTDSVYGESHNDYKFKEDDDHQPLNEYGKQKSLAEKVVLSYGYNVIHYPFLIGKSLTHKPHFYDYIIKDLNNGKNVDAFEDSYRSSIDFNSATLYTLKLIDKFNNQQLGIINICSDDKLSKYDVILQIATKHGFKENMIKPISSKKKNDIFLANRACITLMNNTYLKELLSIQKIEIQI